MELGFETIGNATLICHDRRPVLVTDPWITGYPYFGSWTLSHQIPDEQRHAIANCEFLWISHGHPDHLSTESLQALRNKKILIPDHVGGLIFSALKKLGYNVHILKDKVWTKLSDHINVLCLCDYNQDALLLVDINGRLVINMNDGIALGWMGFVRQIVKNYHTSFYLKLEGVGDVDMLNFFDEHGNRILRNPDLVARPLGPSIARKTEYMGARFFVPFSSMHKYQRQDSIWIQPYATSLSDYAKGFDSQSSEILPAFIKYDCTNDTWEKIDPPEVPLVIRDPGEFGDHWEEPLEKADIEIATRYFKAIFHLTRTLDFINLRVGGIDNIIELGKKNFDAGITFEAPRHSLMLAIQYEIFDDMLIGNFMKTTLHGKLKSEKPTLHPYFEPYVPKYADNGRAKSKQELAAYFKEYKKRTGSMIDLLLLHKLEEKSKTLKSYLPQLEEHSKNIFRFFIPQDSLIYQRAKRVYHLVRRNP
jgi:hypothetical protein